MRQTKRWTAVMLLSFLVLGLGLSAQVKKTKSASSGTQLPLKSESAETVRKIVTSGRLDDLRWPVFSDYRTHLDKFYRPAGYELAWVRNGEVTPEAQAIIGVLGQADNQGLRAEDYDASRWADRLTLLKQSHSPADEARFDVALTVCTMRYISDRRIGRINPQRVKFELDISEKKVDLAELIRKHLAEGGDPESKLPKLDPPFPGYQRAHAALLRYMELAKQDSGHKLPTPAVTVYPAGPYNDIAGLAAFLRLVGDLPENATVTAGSTMYDNTLVEGVKRFQKRHGLPVNGWLDAATLEQMNVPLSQRVEQLRLVLERYRWLRYKFSQPPIAVNVPEFVLYALDADGRVGMTMGVNVGDAFDHQTPIFENTIKYLVFRPYWNVPPWIQRNEIVPAIVEDRDYIKDNLFEVVTPSGKLVTSGRISDAVLQQIRAGKLLVREKPNPENALGLLKIIFPNKHNVYLHDTPNGVDMFSGERARSHGCIHLQEPAKMAAWLLRDQGWDLKAAEQAMHSGRDNVTVNLKNPVPIFIIYGTAVVKEDGTVHFYRDIYGHDATLQKALAKGYPYPQ